MPGAGGALGQGHAFGHLHDPQRVQPARSGVEQGGADPDKLLGRARIGDRDEDPGRQRGATHRASVQCSTRYGLASSNSRACRSTRSSAASVETLRFSMTKLPTRPK